MTTDELVALVKTISGVVDEVVIGTDAEELEAIGEEWAADSSKCEYQLVNDVRIHESPGQPLLMWALARRPRLLGDGRFADFRVTAGQRTLALISVGRGKLPWGRPRRDQSKAVRIETFRPVGGSQSQRGSVRDAIDYLEALGLDPTPLVGRARQKGWQTSGEP